MDSLEAQEKASVESNDEDDAPRKRRKGKSKQSKNMVGEANDSSVSNFFADL